MRFRRKAPTCGSTCWRSRPTRNTKEAHAFINYLLDPQVIAKVSASVVTPTRTRRQAYMDQALVNNPEVYPSQAVLDKLYISSTPPQSIMRLMTRSWSKVKSNK
jgi:putative spermidine/putrescine transport system substrate-binding protein/putrescine transport system substrate-binding protein